MRTDPADAALVEASLEIAAQAAGDLTPAVYERLFERYPELERLFWRDSDGSIKGEMLARVFEAILDFVGVRLFADHMIRCEVITHEGYDVPRAVFPAFFGIVAEVLREACANDWTGDMDAAWTRVLADLEAYVENAPVVA
jgi:hemoglobin-like flavoprotein